MSSAAMKLANAADTSSEEAQSLIADMRKAVNTMRSIAVEFEKANMSDKVKEVEKEMLELLASYEDCAFLAEAVKAVPQIYQPSDQPTDFKKLIEAEVTKIKGNSRVSGHCQQLVRQFREAVWDVHHAGQPMPGDEQEELVMTSTQRNILNIKCPITMKPIIELTDPVRCTECRHIYDKNPIMSYIRNNKPPRCPIAGCPKMLHIGNVVCDSMLRVEIDEFRSSGAADSIASDVEDISDLDDDEEEPMDEDSDHL